MNLHYISTPCFPEKIQEVIYTGNSILETLLITASNATFPFFSLFFRRIIFKIKTTLNLYVEDKYTLKTSVPSRK